MIYPKLQRTRTHRNLIIISLWSLLLVGVASSIAIINPVQGQKLNQNQQLFANNLLTYVTTYGINSTTGNVFAFVNAHGITITKTFNATKLDMMDNKTDGIALTSFVFQNLALKPGEPFTTCAVVINSAKMVCVTDYKTPFPRAQYVDIPLS